MAFAAPLIGEAGAGAILQPAHDYFPWYLLLKIARYLCNKYFFELISNLHSLDSQLRVIRGRLQQFHEKLHIYLHNSSRLYAPSNAG